MRRLRIAIVTPGFVADREEPGLAAVVDLVERLALVHDCQVVALRHPPARPPYTVAGATVRTIGAGSEAGPLGRSAVLARGVRAVLRLHRRRPIDLVHALWGDEAGAVAAVSARLVRRPSMVSFLGGELARIPDIGYGAALGVGGRLTVATALRLGDVVTAGSSTLRDSVRERGPRGTVALLPLGVDVTLFRPAEEPRPGPPTILFVGSLEPVKDPAAALRTFAAVARDRRDLRLTIVGDGGLRRSLEDVSAELGVVGRVAFLGQLPRVRMPEVYRSASLLLVTSRHEGQSMVAVEAAATGLPVVGTRVGILPDLGDAALTVRIGDEDGLAAAVARVLDDAELATRMGAAARATAVARFDLDRTAAEVLATYDDLVTRGGARDRRS
jgi:glycosyltransferase involved in cell wall biosynthesis